MKKEMIDIRDMDFTPYGTYLQVPKGEKAPLDTGYSRCWARFYKLDMGEYMFGIEEVDYRPTLAIPKLEQHRECKEVNICGDHSVAIALCLPRDKNDFEEHPNIEDVVVVKYHPGDILVLDEHVWHSGNMPLRQNAHYFFMYRVRDEEIYWRDINGGPVELDMTGE